jgi:hypothetical protein
MKDSRCFLASLLNIPAGKKLSVVETICIFRYPLMEMFRRKRKNRASMANSKSRLHNKDYNLTILKLIGMWE